jgi:hypothetical protein
MHDDGDDDEVGQAGPGIIIHRFQNQFSVWYMMMPEKLLKQAEPLLRTVPTTIHFLEEMQY